MIACNLGDLRQQQALPQRIGNWSVTNLRRQMLNGVAIGTLRKGLEVFEPGETVLGRLDQRETVVYSLPTEGKKN